MYGGANALVGAAATQVGHGHINVSICGVRLTLEQSGCSHQHATLAVTTLWNLLRDPGFLQRVQAVCTPEGLDGGDVLTCYRRRRHHARAHGLTIHMHCAGPTGGNPATELGAGEIQLIAQHPQQGRTGVGSRGQMLTVDVQVQECLPMLVCGC